MHSTRRTIIWTLSFTLKGQLYPDIKSGSVIKTIEVNFRIPGDEKEDFEVNFITLETSQSLVVILFFSKLETMKELRTSRVVKVQQNLQLRLDILSLLLQHQLQRVMIMDLVKHLNFLNQVETTM